MAKDIHKTVVHTDEAPQPVGPYSQATKADGWVYVSGQIPMDPATGNIVMGPIETAAELVFKNLTAVLDASGGSAADTMKVTIYLTNMGDFPVVNEIYGRFFGAEARHGGEPPARACIQAAALPKGVPIEADLVAYIGTGHRGLGLG